MSLTAEDIALLLQREGSGLSPEEYDESPQSAEAHQRRVTLLADVLETCVQAFRSKDLWPLQVIAQKLGDGSRDVAWRLPYGEAGILDFFLGEVLPSIEIRMRSELKVHSLRITGNSCADTDENRARVVDGQKLGIIIDYLEDESVWEYTVPVLYNILVDYEPAQRLALRSGLNDKLTTFLSELSLPDYAHLISYICKIFALLIAFDGEEKVANPRTVKVLLEFATEPDAYEGADDFISLASVAVAYLANETCQTEVVKDGSLGLFLTAFEMAYSYAEFEDDADRDADTATSLKQLRTSLLTTLADLTANEHFLTSYPLDSPVPQKLLSWLKGDNPQLQSAACLGLGNLSRSDETSLALVQDHQIHLPLAAILSDPSTTDSQQLHSALSFLKNLAIPAKNKELLGDLLEPSCVPRILVLDTLPQVQYSAISLVRLLLVNCAPNVRRISAPRDSSDATGLHTTLHDLLALFDRSDAEPTKLEAARSIAALCRVLHSTPVLGVLPEWVAMIPKDEDLDVKQKESKVRQLLYSKHEFSKPLAFLITQPKWPLLRSEAWFVFALISRSNEGTRLALDILEPQGAVDALTQAITGRTPTEPSSVEKQQIEAPADASETEVAALTERLTLEPQQVDPKQKADMTKVDRENCLVLCTHIIKNSAGSGILPERLELLDSLVKEGTSLHVAANKT